MSQRIKVYITKYALGMGVLLLDAEEKEDGYVAVQLPGSAYPQWINKHHWHRDRESAIKKADEMRKKRVAALSKQIAKLEAMTFEVKDD